MPAKTIAVTNSRGYGDWISQSKIVLKYLRWLIKSDPIKFGKMRFRDCREKR